MNIIDSRVRLRTKQLMKAWTTHLNPVFKDYIEWYHMRDRLSVVPTAKLLEEAAEEGVEKMVVCGGNREDNEHILEISQEFRAVIPVGGVHLKDGIRAAVDEVTMLKDQGFAGVNLSPFMMKMDVNDRRLYPVYAQCERLEAPIIVHSSMHYWRDAYLSHNILFNFDEVAVDFPGLKLIMSHGGNGFGPTVLAVAQRHPNVYLEYSALNPRYMAPEFIHATNTYLSKKCMFGTDYPLVEFGRGINMWKEALRPEVHEDFFHNNVLRALYDPPQ